MGLLSNVVSFWPNFFRETSLLYSFGKNVKSLRKELEGHSLRIDWLGRIYTVITLKEEFRSQPDVVQQSVVFQELKPTSDILMKYGLSDYAYPEIEKIDDSFSFLVVLYPETDYFNFWRFIWNILFLGILITITRFLYPIVYGLISYI